MTEIMKAIKAAVKEASTRNLTQEGTIHIFFQDKRYDVPVIREFEPRRVSLCNKSDCNAGDDCCHQVTVDSVELCRDSSERWVMRDKRGSWIRQCEGDSDETHFWEDFKRALIALEAEMDKQRKIKELQES